MLSAGSEYWRPIWNLKTGSHRELAGRSTYTAWQRAALVNDAIMGLELTHGDTLLDVGCASGFTGLPLARFVREYTGLDYSQPALDRFAEDKPGNAALVLGSALDLPFPDKNFDKAYMGSVLLCLDKTECERALRELKRVTRTRAFVADTMFGAPGPCVRQGPACSCFAHQTAFEIGEFIELLARAGWVQTHIVPMHYSLPHYDMAMDCILQCD